MEAELLTPFALSDRLPLRVAFAVGEMLMGKRNLGTWKRSRRKWQELSK
jgi:hypothetical protein